jgi:hypothetical protein
MEFYIFRVLFPAILLDISLTAVLLRKDNLLRRNRRALGAFVTAPLYLVAAMVWILILGIGDPRFQGQGVIGLVVFGVIGIVFTILRLMLGVMLFPSLRHR